MMNCTAVVVSLLSATGGSIDVDFDKLDAVLHPVPNGWQLRVSHDIEIEGATPVVLPELWLELFEDDHPCVNGDLPVQIATTLDRPTRRRHNEWHFDGVVVADLPLHVVRDDRDLRILATVYHNGEPLERKKRRVKVVTPDVDIESLKATARTVSGGLEVTAQFRIELEDLAESQPLELTLRLVDRKGHHLSGDAVLQLHIDHPTDSEVDYRAHHTVRFHPHPGLPLRDLRLEAVAGLAGHGLTLDTRTTRVR